MNMFLAAFLGCAFAFVVTNLVRDAATQLAMRRIDARMKPTMSGPMLREPPIEFMRAHLTTVSDIRFSEMAQAFDDEALRRKAAGSTIGDRTSKLAVDVLHAGALLDAHGRELREQCMCELCSPLVGVDKRSQQTATALRS